MHENPHIWIYTDGSCTGTNVGAWAAAIVHSGGQKHKILYGLEGDTTINRCEFEAIIAAMRYTRERIDNQNAHLRIQIITDSEHTAKLISGVYAPKTNKDLYAKWLAVSEGANFKIQWNARNSSPWMKTVDAIAYGLRKEGLRFGEAIADLNYTEEAADEAD